MIGPRSRRPSDFKISHATRTSSTGSAVSETRIVSPIPSTSSAPMPTALLIEPAYGVPASVTPRCSGYGTFADSIRYALIIVGTWLDLTEILKSRKSRLSSSRTSSSAASTSASAWSRCASSVRCFGSEPELAPIRIGIPAAFAARTTCATLSEPPMLPGLMRTAATPWSIAFSARLALKWMPAITKEGLVGEPWFPAPLAASETVDVVREPDEHQHQEQRDPDCGDTLVHLPGDCPAAYGLDDREKDVAAVERQQRQ